MSNTKLSAVSMKEALWETLNKLQIGEVEAAVADSIAAQAREIIRTTKVQLDILRQAQKSVSKELVEFSAPTTQDTNG